MSPTLNAVLEASEALLAEGAADRGSVWRNPTLVTLGNEVIPKARTVVLRGYDRQSRSVAFHTDKRSAKFGELAAQPAAGLHGWDASRQIQLRLTGRATLQTGDAADAAWAALRPGSRAVYRVQPGPGTAIVAPDCVAQSSEAEARQFFCLVTVEYQALEYLHLGGQGHRRARFTWSGGQMTSAWLSP